MNSKSEKQPVFLRAELSLNGVVYKPWGAGSEEDAANSRDAQEWWDKMCVQEEENHEL